jgi:hypothetical protein
MHFLKKVIETPSLESPSEKHLDVHRHYYRYSRGDFIGPALKITRTSSKITLKGSHEYEDLILELVTKSISDPKQEFEIKGKLISGSDISEEIANLGLDWNLKMSTGKTKNYKADILDQINKETLINAIGFFRKNSYLLLSYNISPNCKITTKKNIPQPSKKKVDEDDVSKRVQFCTGYLNISDNNIKMVIDEALPDFKPNIPDKWKSIIILNNYVITDIILPENVKNSMLLRIMSTRKGRMTRTLEIDGDIIEKQYNIVV